MKNIFQTLLLVFLLTSCEDVVNVKLETAPSQLVIDAPIIWDINNETNPQTFKLSETTGYFENETKNITGADIKVTDSQGNIFLFEDKKNGDYICNNFIPILNETYTLEVTYKNNVYIATEKITPTPKLEKIYDTIEDSFIGEKTTQVSVEITDDLLTKNYYLISYKTNTEIFSDYGVRDDLITKDGILTDIYRSDKLTTNDIVNISISEISEGYYNYLRILLSIAGNSGGGPFSTPSATVKGNIINQTDKNKNPLGYFRASQVNNITYTITSKE